MSEIDGRRRHKDNDHQTFHPFFCSFALYFVNNFICVLWFCVWFLFFFLFNVLILLKWKASVRPSVHHFAASLFRWKSSCGWHLPTKRREKRLWILNVNTWKVFYFLAIFSLNFSIFNSFFSIPIWFPLFYSFYFVFVPICARVKSQ